MKDLDIRYPESRVQDIVETLHGEPVADPYRWLEDVKSEEVQNWMTAQNDVTRRYLDALNGRDLLHKRFSELFYVDSLSAPVKRGDRYFYTRRHADREKAIIYWKQGVDGEEKILLDPNTMDKEGRISINLWFPSWNGAHVAYTQQWNNADESTLYVLDVASGEVSKTDVIEGAKYAWPSWTPDNKGFYYAWLPNDEKTPIADRPGLTEIRYHELGKDPQKDPVIYPALKNPKAFLNTGLSRDGRWLFIYISHGWSKTEIFVKDLQSKESKFAPFFTGRKAQAQVTVWKDQFYILTNDEAPNWKVMKTHVTQLDRHHWKTVIPESKDAVIDGMNIVGDRMALTLLKNATSLLHVHELDGSFVREIELPATLGSSWGLRGEPDDDEAYFMFQSFTIPNRIYKTSMASGETALWSEVKVPVDPEPYTVEQVWFPSKDGAKVSMFIIRRKDMPMNGSTPFILNGYGGFNVSLTPSFYGSIYPWLEAGGGYAVANLRGGGEYGENWHKDGMLDKKQNVFDDFIAAAEFLVKSEYTASDRLAISGGSNGGLLVGAAMTQRPELFAAVICAVPLLDMVRYHLFGSGKTWIPEYGSAETKDGFKTLFAYSPYHRVQKGAKYPATLFLASDSDDRVDPLHARKMAAQLQANSSRSAPVLLRIQKNAGHGGADMIKEAVNEKTDMYTFLFNELNFAGSGKHK